MQNPSIQIEEERLTNGFDEKPLMRERHRAFPAIFENRQHQRILDTAAGIGYLAKEIHDHSSGQVFCNDLTPTCLISLRKLGLPVTRFTLDSESSNFPLASGSFDAVISTSTIEHIFYIDRFVAEVFRILKDEGCLYISTPNYASPLYLWPVLFEGRTFHDPIKPNMRYEFYGHIRYFTYRTLFDYVTSFGFKPEAVYLPLPKTSTIYQDMLQKNPLKAFVFRYGMNFLYRLSPRWASEPILCFRKTNKPKIHFRKVIM